MKDSELWPKVVSEDIFFVTADKGFGDIRAYPPGTHSGILLLRPDSESLLEYRALLANFVEKHDLESLMGATIVVTPKGVRIRRSPSDTQQ
ncbi:MAG: DUF5615 family PIN-like protein [Phycisphaerales bacterium]|nr:DUF5615 family PIN-like protein [Phycisphaerales bacterium]